MKNLQDSELLKLLKDARECVNILNENLTLFVKVILVNICVHISKEIINSKTFFFYFLRWLNG